MGRNIPLAVAIAWADPVRPKYVIAALAGITPNTLSSILAGRLPLTPARAERLADVLGIEPAEIMPADDTEVVS